MQKNDWIPLAPMCGNRKMAEKELRISSTEDRVTFRISEELAHRMGWHIGDRIGIAKDRKDAPTRLRLGPPDLGPHQFGWKLQSPGKDQKSESPGTDQKSVGGCRLCLKSPHIGAPPHLAQTAAQYVVEGLYLVMDLPWALQLADPRPEPRAKPAKSKSPAPAESPAPEPVLDPPAADSAPVPEAVAETADPSAPAPAPVPEAAAAEPAEPDEAPPPPARWVHSITLAEASANQAALRRAMGRR